MGLKSKSNYRTRAIITRGLYTFYPLCEVHLCTVTFGLMYGLYSRAGYSGARTVKEFIIGLLCAEEKHIPYARHYNPLLIRNRS